MSTLYDRSPKYKAFRVNYITGKSNDFEICLNGKFNTAFVSKPNFFKKEDIIWLETGRRFIVESHKFLDLSVLSDQNPFKQFGKCYDIICNEISAIPEDEHIVKQRILKFLQGMKLTKSTRTLDEFVQYVGVEKRFVEEELDELSQLSDGSSVKVIPCNWVNGIPNGKKIYGLNLEDGRSEIFNDLYKNTTMNNTYNFNQNISGKGPINASNGIANKSIQVVVNTDNPFEQLIKIVEENPHLFANKEMVISDIKNLEANTKDDSQSLSWFKKVKKHFNLPDLADIATIGSAMGQILQIMSQINK